MRLDQDAPGLIGERVSESILGTPKVESVQLRAVILRDDVSFLGIGPMKPPMATVIRILLFLHS
jgi:hypothetical protein